MEDKYNVSALVKYKLPILKVNLQSVEICPIHIILKFGL